MSMKVLFVSNLYPDVAETGRGLYNARLVQHLGRLCAMRVLSPRPVLPFCTKVQRQPRLEDAGFAPVYAPAWRIPRIGSRWNPRLMAWSLKPAFEKLRSEFAFEAVLVSWVYPDACAVARLAAQYRFPFVAVAQGSDVHQYLRQPVRRRLIVQALNQAKAVVARSAELARLLREAGVAAQRVHVIYNGVDTTVFKPGNREQERARLGLPLEARVVLYVGNFLPIKNPLLLVAAFAELKKRFAGFQTRLVMLGDGPLEESIKRCADSAGIAGDLVMPGRKPENEVARYMQAADVLAVPSNNEGLPNVVLEAFATGLPVVATSVGGIPEVMPESAPYLGRLVGAGNVAEMAAALEHVLQQERHTEMIVRHARAFSWESTAAAYLELLTVR